MTILTQRARGANSDTGGVADAAIQTGGITINQDAYDSSLDRIYDVKGLQNMYVEIKNTGGANGLTFKIEKARAEFTEVSELVNADFDEEIKGDTNVAFGANDMTTISLISPEITAIRVRIKRQTASNDTTLGGFVSGNE